ncbi:MAG: NAD(P)-dependent oxidoreductase [Candidatus Eremiobacteraeota bacterium]|nr:NAD(P)-dependent oxidoreductase [Candidatus Eremiobacteraeota bacterium]MCW5868800.1 NAD(P)-dependent oxidoreductase [Candidatus Eremiobacteraeota bacterium]
MSGFHVLITGGAGYIGSILTERLLRAGHYVTVIDSLLYRQRSLFGFCHESRFEFVFGDARDARVMADLIRGKDFLIPLAALVGAPACDRDPLFAQTVNLEAVRLINSLRSGQQAVIYPNTNSGYGAQTGESFCTEETPLEPISHYGRTKVEAEKALLDSARAVTFRLATVFGMSYRMRLDLLVNDFVHTALRQRALVLFEKDFKRNYVHIRDVADAFLYAMNHFDAMQGRPYNVGLDDANLSKEQLAVLIQRFIPGLSIQSAEIGEDPDKRNYIVSNARLREAGFEARRTLEEGIQELLKGYRMMQQEEFRNV